MTLPARPVLTRYALAALTAWLLPSYAVLAAMVIEDGSGSVFEPMLLVNGPLMGLFFGWPCFLLGGAAWAWLHRTGRSRPIYAALVGAAAPLLPIGFLVIKFGRLGDTVTSIVPVPLATTIVAIGAVTGLAVWRIAYPRAPSADPRQP